MASAYRCYAHPESAAVAFCALCRRPLCVECDRYRGSQGECRHCHARLFAESLPVAPPPAPFALPPAPFALPPAPISRLSPLILVAAVAVVGAIAVAAALRPDVRTLLLISLGVAAASATGLFATRGPRDFTS